jgi:hypothetical protein
MGAFFYVGDLQVLLSSSLVSLTAADGNSIDQDLH